MPPVVDVGLSLVATKMVWPPLRVVGTTFWIRCPRNVLPPSVAQVLPPPLTAPMATRFGLVGSIEIVSAAPAAGYCPCGTRLGVVFWMPIGPTGSQTGGGPRTGAGPPMVIDGTSRSSSPSTRSPGDG